MSPRPHRSAKSKGATPPLTALQQRAVDFLASAIPVELQPNYVAGSLAEIVIAKCAHQEPADAELLEIAGMAATEYDAAIARATTPELKVYYAECQALLRKIIEDSALPS